MSSLIMEKITDTNITILKELFTKALSVGHNDGSDFWDYNDKES
jgi:hypothetical protein